MADFHLSGQATSTTSETVGPFTVDRDSNQLGLFVSGTFVASLQVQVSADGVSFADFGSPVTAPGYLALPACHAVQIVNTYTSGTVQIEVGGLRKEEN